MTGKIKFIITIILICSSLSYANVNISVTADKTTLSLSDSAVISVTVSSSNSSVPQIIAPKVSNGSLYSQGSSSSMSIINGSVSSSNEYTYVFVPSKIGKVVIPPFTTNFNGKKISSKILTLNILKSSAKRSQQNNYNTTNNINNSNIDINNNVFIKSIIDKTKVYPNEPIVYTIKLYYNANVQNFEFVKNPSFDGFWTEDVKPSSRQHYENINGKRYIVQELYKKILFPMSSREYTIPKISLKFFVKVRDKKRRKRSGFGGFFDDDFDSFFGRYKLIPKVLSTNPVKLIVNDFPLENKPKNFSGCVGQFNIKSSINKTSLKTNEAVELNITITGTGNIKQFNAPKLDLGKEFKIFETKSNTNSTTSNGFFQGKKNFKYVIVSKTPGIKKIHPVSISYFNSSKKKYVTISTKPIVLNIEKGNNNNKENSNIIYNSQNSIIAAGTDIQFIKTNNKIINNGKKFYKSSVFKFYIIIFPLIYLIIMIFKKKREKLYSNSSLLRYKNAYKNAYKKLNNIEKIIIKNNSKEFYNEINKTLSTYISDKLDIPAASFSIDNVNNILKEKSNISSENINSLKKVIDKCEISCFASTQNNTDDMKNTFIETKNIIKKLEKINFGANS